MSAVIYTYTVGTIHISLRSTGNKQFLYVLYVSRSVLFGSKTTLPTWVAQVRLARRGNRPTAKDAAGSGHNLQRTVVDQETA
jgi:hypothetical protein